MVLPRWYSGKESACPCRRGKRLGFHPGSGRFPGEGNGNPLQYSCWENPMGRGTRWATICGVAKNQTQLSWHGPYYKQYKCEEEMALYSCSKAHHRSMCFRLSKVSISSKYKIDIC